MQSTYIGNPAPPFDLPCTRFPDPSRTRSRLADYLGRWLVLVFYPRDFSLICPTELIGLCQRFDEFERQDCELLGISCDSVESHERWIATPSAGGAGRTELPAGQRPGRRGRSELRGLPDEAAGRGARALHHRPGGLVQYQVVHNLSVGRRSQEVLRVLMALQSGGLCREDWMADDPTFDPFKAIRPGSYLLALPDRGRGRLRDVRAGLPGAGPPARPAGGAEGLQAGLPGDAECRPGRGPRGGRAEPPEPLHDLRRGRHGGRADHRDGIHRGPADQPACGGRAGCRSIRSSRSPGRSPRGWRPPTRPASCTATSSRRT